MVHLTAFAILVFVTCGFNLSLANEDIGEENYYESKKTKSSAKLLVLLCRIFYSRECWSSAGSTEMNIFLNRLTVCISEVCSISDACQFSNEFLVLLQTNKSYHKAMRHNSTQSRWRSITNLSNVNEYSKLCFFHTVCSWNSGKQYFLVFK